MQNIKHPALTNMGWTTRVCATLVLLQLAAFNAHAEIYKWVDKDGKVHYGDDSKAAPDQKNDIAQVKIHDKYVVPKVKKLTPKAITENELNRTIVLTKVNLALPRSDRQEILIGRITCGRRPQDIYWRDGYLPLNRQSLAGTFAEAFKKHEIKARIGKALGGTGDLELVATVEAIKMNTCKQRRHSSRTKDESYLNIKWVVKDSISGEELVVLNTQGSHHAMNRLPIQDGLRKSLQAAFNMSAVNLLASPAFIEHLEPVDLPDLEELGLEELSLKLQYENPFGPFEQSAEALKNRTVTVKTQNGHGSGVFIAEQGYILTNAHVVQKETEFTILSAKDRFKAKLVAKNNHRDVALLKVTSNKNKIPSPAAISPEAPNIGSELYVIGTPLDLSYSHTITKGIVSAKRRIRGLPFYQTDAAINRGNSGGPVFNKEGALVAISVSAVLTNGGASLNINYLIPIDDALADLNINRPDIKPTSLAQHAQRLNLDLPVDLAKNSTLLNKVWAWLAEPVFRFSGS